ncbi:MAG TPA: toll/interleukin-1 receptor domain-containing protein [Candidatus Sulfotelmatobacter sp.]|nr:toll/interleukin-1 receptor domain-containing protein [Candidatus Sulfotelmatobacter sp.]
MAHDVFISHSSKDKAIADAVCARLEARGIRCWIAPRDVEPGQPYGEAIIDAIHTCRIMVLLLSSNANNSIHIAKEVERAVSHGATVIPLRIEEVLPGKSLDYFIGSVHWLDALTPPLDRHLDNLADTILKILPPRPSPLPPVVPPGPPPKPAIVPETLPGPVPLPQKKTWLVPAIVSAAAVAVILAIVLWGRSGPATQTAGGNAGANENPTPVSSGLPGASNRRVSGSDAASGIDPVIGCWRWFNNGSVVISPNGLMTAGPFTAQWRSIDRSRRTYTFTWPEAVDSITLSPDGRTLSGGNQYGYSMSATKLAGGPGLPGTWRWYNGVIVAIQPGGTFSANGVSGHWRGAGLSYSLTWPKPVDTVTLSADQNRIEGHDQYGIHISGTKTANCGGS